ncbi:MAG: hypothetical protein JRN25_07435 [Nitrososphaerota archaeon]|nr:hypothetical protein [Nitrososphaerota archaeon]
MVGSVIGKPGTLPETLEHVTLDVMLLETAVGAAELVKVGKVKLSETVRLNLGTASTLAVATSVKGEVVELDLKKPVAIESGTGGRKQEDSRALAPHRLRRPEVGPIVRPPAQMTAAARAAYT